MNASQLHLWIMETLEPLKAATWDEMNATIGEPLRTAEYFQAAGEHEGLHKAISAALDLVQKMQAEEREAVAAGLADLGMCDLCGSEEGQRTKERLDGVTAWVCGSCQPTTDGHRQQLSR